MIMMNLQEYLICLIELMEKMQNKIKKLKKIYWMNYLKFLLLILIKVNEDKKQCVICFGEFKNGDKVIILPCIHFYHSECIKMWFKIKKNIWSDCKCEINEKNLYGEEGKQETPGK